MILNAVADDVVTRTLEASQIGQDTEGQTEGK